MRLPRALVLVLAAGAATQCNASPPAPEPLAKTHAALAWATTAAGTPRYFHAAVAMNDGRVLVAGGFGSPGGASTEIYDPATNTWTSAGSLSQARQFPIGARLPSGKIMIAGGEVSTAIGEKTVDIYDPTTGTWSVGPSLAAGSTRGSAISLADGRILLLSAYAPGAIYDESTSSWTPTNPSITRSQPGMVRLSTGKVLVVGGSDSSGPNSIAEVFDPATGWSTTGFTKVPRTGHVAALLPGDKVLVAGGDYAGAVSSAEIWDPATGKWTDAPSMSEGRKLIGGGRLPDGKVLAAFGNSNATGEVFDPVANLWRPALGGQVPRIYTQAVTTPSGSIVFTGGMNANTFALIGTPEVFTEGALGSTCGSAGECASGICVDGTCCSSTCTGTCQACNVTGHLGTCTTVDGEAPHPPRSCAPFGKCVAGACVTSCAVNSDCASDKYCIAPTCVPKTTNGLACASNDQCASGFCVDGVCCSSACTDKCAACDVVGSFGDCAPVDGQPRGGRAPCTGTAVGTACGEKCDGDDPTACHYPTTSISCGADSCTDGIETHAGACDGAGLCATTSASCGVYACSGASCKTTCSADVDCKPGYYCNGSACVAVEGLGSACTTAATCKTGACVDGVCCGSASCPDGTSCKVAGHEGSCVKLAGQACAINEECGTGFCVDGVCCDSACDGTCEACDVAGSKGTCSPVVGAPHAARTKCDAGGDDVCKARTCDGVERKSCAGYASGAAVTCRASICKGDVLALEGHCDGAGACEMEKTSSCLPFACVGRACATSCSADDQCGSEFRCEGGSCVSRNAKCSDDGLSSVPLGGEPKSCEPYRCASTGECGTTCDTSAQCAPGSVCDSSTKSCVTGAPTADSGGGCSMGNRPAPWAGAMFGMLLAMVLTRRAQRRNRAWLALFATSAVIACTSSKSQNRAEPTALSAIRATHAFDGRLRDAIAPTRELTVDGFARALPLNADEPMRMNAASVRPLDVRHVAGEIVGSTVLYRDAAPETDLVVLSTAAHAEELRVLHGKGAPSTFRWSIEGAHASVEGDRVVLRDDKGAELVHADPIDAIDALGERRFARLEVQGSTLIARFDFSGMRHPIVVDPAWSAGPAMTSPRSQHSMVRLKDNRVLIVGGGFGSTILSSVDVYDPAAGTITAAAPLHSPRFGDSVLLDDGRVLTVGYTYGSEIYDPTANTWTTLATYPTAFEAMVKLPDGRAMGVGSCTATSDFFDPATGAWSAGPPMIAKRLSPQVTVLSDGRVLAVGGDACGGGWLTSAEIWSPTTNTWTNAGTFSSTIRAQAAITALPGKKALLTGGGGSKAATMYDGNTNTWTEMAPMANDRWFHKSSLLPNGRVIVVGGQVSSGSEKVEVYDPVANTWSSGGTITTERINVRLAPLASGALFVAGGKSGGATLDTTEIFTLVPNGGACGQPGECNTGFCVTGLCCDKACTGGCEACNLAGTSGTCTSVSGEPPVGKSCTGFSCNAGVCRATCASASDCDSTHFCNGGSCSAKRLDGQTCSAAVQCASGICVDGTCCNRACDGQCEACDTPDARGTCVGAVGAPHGTRAACTGAGVGTECGPSCDGKDLTKCTYAKTTTFCSASTCSGTTETHASFCDGAGACKDVPKDCGAYACGATTCKTTCAAGSDCAPGSYCKGSTCTRYEDLGVACASGSACKTGFCVDGVCCASAACDAGSTCSPSGTCKKRAGVSCTMPSDCGSGFCVDGVCCDKACDGQCEACDVATSRGTCTAVVGAPHGSRTACEAGADECKAKSCDGKDRASCAGFAPETVTCAKAKCDGSTFAAVSFCDGKGTCTASKSTACAPYACDDLGCLASCAGDKQCADGFVCNKGTCEPKHPHCSDDLSHAIAVDGTSTDCAPYRCGPAGACLTACASSSDCGGGAVCGGDKLCVAVDAGTADSGSGCSTGRTGVGSGAFASVIALIALGTARRRRSSSGKFTSS